MGITGTCIVHAHPVSKLIHGRFSDAGLHATTSARAPASAVSTWSSHRVPAGMLVGSLLTKTSHCPGNAPSIHALSAMAIGPSSEMWLTKTIGSDDPAWRVRVGVGASAGAVPPIG